MKITVKEKSTLLDFLLEKMDSISRTNAKKILRNGQVAVNGKPESKAGRGLQKGDIIEISRGTLIQEKEKPSISVIYEDDYLIAADKPAGLLTISTEKEKRRTFYRMVSDYVKSSGEGDEKIFIVHRLDREASGIIIFAKNQSIKEKLQKNWDKTEKIYQALVEGHPPRESGTVKNFLCENKAHIVYVCDENIPGAQFAITHYKFIRRYRGNALLEIKIETGRKNQIRVHLASIGIPVAGDMKYGAKEKRKRMGLHALSLSFQHPVTRKKISLKSPLPPGFLPEF